MLKSYVSVQLSNESTAKIREISFSEFKSLCKLLYTDDSRELENSFDSLIKEICLTPLEQINVLDKFLIILASRNTTLGNELLIKYKDRSVNLNLSRFLDIQQPTIEIDDMLFSPPINFNTADTYSLLVNCFKEYKGVNVSNFTYKQKEEIVNNLNISLKNFINMFVERIKEKNITIYKDLIINFFMPSNLIDFLKLIYYENIQDIIQFQYTLKRDLRLNSSDFMYYTYPELKILYNYYLSDTNAGENSGSYSGDLSPGS